jgi:hypothetical protein
MNTFGALVRPVIFPNSTRMALPSGTWSSSMTLYFAPSWFNTPLARLQKGHVVWLNIITPFSAIMASILLFTCVTVAHRVQGMGVALKSWPFKARCTFETMPKKIAGEVTSIFCRIAVPAFLPVAGRMDLPFARTWRFSPWRSCCSERC